MRSTLLLLTLAAVPTAAQIQWVPSNSTAAPAAVGIAGGRHLCRGLYNGSQYSGNLEGGTCTITDGTSDNAVAAAPFEIAVGAGRWDLPGDPNPVVGGTRLGQPLYACRVSGDRAGWAATTNGPCVYHGSDGHLSSSQQFELLYPFETAPILIAPKRSDLPPNREICMSRVAPFLAEDCSSSPDHQWVLVPAELGFFKIGLSGTGSCLHAGSGALSTRPCSAADRFQIRWRYGNRVSFIAPNGNMLVVNRVDTGVFGVRFPWAQASPTTFSQAHFEINPVAVEARNFRLMTYNMMLLSKYVSQLTFPFPVPLFPNLAQDFRAREIPKKINDFTGNPDVIVVNEGFDDDAREILIAEFRRRGYLYATEVPSFRPFIPDDGGVFMVSRWPIEAQSTIIYTDKSGVDLLSSKGASYARINKLGKIYHVFATHLQADDTDVALRQLIQLGTFISQVVTNRAEVILIAGDMNIDMELQPAQYDSMLASLNAQFINPPRPRGVPVGPVQFRWTTDSTTNDIKRARSSGLSQAWIDYILVGKYGPEPTTVAWDVKEYKTSPQFEMELQLGLRTKTQHNDLSDHAAVIGAFRFPHATSVIQPKTVKVDFRVGIENGPNLANSSIRLDAVTLAVPVERILNIGQLYQVGVDEILHQADGRRERFVNWSNGGAREQVFAASSGLTQLRANYVRQVEVTGSVNPPGAGTVSGLGWQTEGAQITRMATPANGYVFSHFTGFLSGTENPRAFVVNTPINFTAHFKQIVTLDAQTATGIHVPGSVAIVEGVAHALPATLQMTPGQSYSLSIGGILAGGAGERYAFAAWNDGGALAHSVTAPLATPKLIAIFRKQYEVTAVVNPPAGGGVTGVGWYDEGVTASLRAVNSRGYSFTGFTGAITSVLNPLPILVVQPISLTANFRSVLSPNLLAISTGPTAPSLTPGNRTVPLAIRNSGPGEALNVRITAILWTDSSGAPTPTGSRFPRMLGSIPVNGQVPVTLEFAWPPTVTRLQFTVFFTADGYSGSTTLNLTTSSP